MDDSISFEFSGSVPDDHDEESCLVRDQNSYKKILSNTKDAFSVYKNEIRTSNFTSYFTTFLQNCQACIPFSLENAGTLVDANEINKSVEYLNDAIKLVQMLIELFKSLVESVSISCYTMETFPTKTGAIIFSVFVHCRDSESLYGQKLKSVEKQLKDLFRICHNLQLTYLMILEKKYTFDLTREKDTNVLLEAIKINLEIGEVVQSLDVKTMAEQWKAYTMLCEKYAQELCEFNMVFQESSQVLCKLIKDNLTNFQNRQDDKVIVRSLKVTSFTIKILIKICSIFRQVLKKDYSVILELLECINLTVYDSGNLEKSVVSQLHGNVAIPSDCLLKELLSEESFVVFLINNITDDNEKGNKFSLILVIASAMRCTTQKRDPNLKMRLIDCVYRILSENSNILLRKRLRNEPRLFTQILVNATAMTLTMIQEEYTQLETRMIRSVLSTEYVGALFSVLLWVTLARQTTSQLLFNQLIWLCTMYKKLATLDTFHDSPQNIQLSNLLSLLFKSISEDDQLKICKQFRVHDDDNVRLWAAVQIRNIPSESIGKAEEAIAEKFKNVFVSLRDGESPDDLINIINLAATCEFKNTRGIDDYLVKAWLKVCLDSQPLVLGLDKDTLWFYEYVKALVALTDSMMYRLKDRSDNFVRILHLIHGLIRIGDCEMKLILTDLLCKIASHDVTGHKNIIDSHLTEAFMTLLQDSEDIVRNNVLITLKSYKQNIYIDNMISNIVRDNEVMQDIWENPNGNSMRILNENACNLNKYTHKCLIAKDIGITLKEIKDTSKGLSEQKSFNSCPEKGIEDFYYDSASSEINDIEEPSSKRGKPNSHEADTAITNLEENVALLLKQNTFTAEQCVRIRNVCERLKNISQ